MREQFGDRLRLLRTERKMTQEELAKIFNTGKASISNYENNARLPDAITISRYAEFFGVTVDYILGRTKNRSEQIKQEGNLHKDNILYKTYIEVFEEFRRKLVQNNIIEKNDPIPKNILELVVKYGDEPTLEILKLRKKQDD